MQNLDFVNMTITEDDIIIPDAHNLCARVRIIRNTQEIIVEHEYVDYYWNETSNREEEAWSWHRAQHQPNSADKSFILKELSRYAENEIVFPRKVC